MKCEISLHICCAPFITPNVLFLSYKCLLHKTSGWQAMQDMTDSVHLEAAMNYFECLVNY